MRNRELMTFEAWISEGNAKVIDNAWSTQDAMWTNRFDTKAELWGYFLREHYGINHAQYFFTEVLKHMHVVTEGEFSLKYSYASDWIVDLFMTTRGAEFGRLANYEGLDFTAKGMRFRLEKQHGRFGKYGKLYMTLEDGVELDDFLLGVSSRTPNC